MFLVAAFKVFYLLRGFYCFLGVLTSWTKDKEPWTADLLICSQSSAIWLSHGFLGLATKR
jgi:hypothetical protein